MPDSRIQLKNTYIAGILAFLIPGAGHFYQGRTFKGCVYFVCILGTCLSGMALGEGKVIYLRMQQGRRTVGYLSQMLVGLPALPALIQNKRYQKMDSDLKTDGVEKLQGIPEGIATTFSGVMRRQDGENGEITGRIEGRIELESASGSSGTQLTGVFRGTFEGREPIEFPLASPISVGPKVVASEDVRLRLLGVAEEQQQKKFSSDRRYLMCQIAEQPEGALNAGLIEGTIPRRFWDWFGVPLEDPTEQDLNGRLGKKYELAMVFTWIAGLLNILAVWDAVGGPAYGYGDEEETEEKPSDEKQIEDAVAEPSPGIGDKGIVNPDSVTGSDPSGPSST